MANKMEATFCIFNYMLISWQVDIHAKQHVCFYSTLQAPSKSEACATGYKETSHMKADG